MESHAAVKVMVGSYYLYAILNIITEYKVNSLSIVHTRGPQRLGGKLGLWQWDCLKSRDRKLLGLIVNVRVVEAKTLE